MSMDPHSPHSGVPYGPEETDANIPLVVWTGVGILFTMVLCAVIVVFQYRFEMAMLPKKDTGPFQQATKLPPEPRLQAFPAKDLVQFKASQSHKAESFGWADKQAGIAHIPVEKAMEMILKNGLPVVLAKPPVAVPAKVEAPKKQ